MVFFEPDEDTPQEEEHEVPTHTAPPRLNWMLWIVALILLLSFIAWSISSS